MKRTNRDNQTTRIIRGAIAAAVLFTFLFTASTPGIAQTSKRRRTSPAPAKPAPAPAIELPPPISEEERKQLAESASQSRANLIAASETYRESLARLMGLQKEDEKRALDLVERRKRLLELGVIARREVEESEQSLAAAQSKVAETVKQLEQIEQLVAEVNAAEQLANLPPEPTGTFKMTGALVRYVGSTRWAMSDFGKVDAFFRLKFGRPLPVSAFGQTDTHNRLGFDHREAVDVALHPESAEGQEVIQFLVKQGISFIAIRSAIPGSATGAHIHIGPSSRRISIR
ncbi:MAG: hypothetical protein SF339_17960 [Blastocatellia bacterium]|nr:hypothetical protein [Blastocatellia bacterium]